MGTLYVHHPGIMRVTRTLHSDRAESLGTVHNSASLNVTSEIIKNNGGREFKPRQRSSHHRDLCDISSVLKTRLGLTTRQRHHLLLLSFEKSGYSSGLVYVWDLFRRNAFSEGIDNVPEIMNQVHTHQNTLSRSSRHGRAHLKHLCVPPSAAPPPGRLECDVFSRKFR
jgi:hypothetical protein